MVGDRLVIKVYVDVVLSVRGFGAASDDVVNTPSRTRLKSEKSIVLSKKRGLIVATYEL